MKKICLLALIFVLNGCADSTPPTNEYSVDKYLGQWVVINYWAKWCKPCIEEIPELNAFDQTYPNVVVLGVNYDGATGEELAQQLQQLQVKFPTLSRDPYADLNMPRPAVLPTTLIIDPEGKLSHTLLGPQTLATLAAATKQQFQHISD
jgi:thiol-disulfide isomerase/thioredoxin